VFSSTTNRSKRRSAVSSVTPTPAPVIEEPKAAAAVLNYGTVVAAPQPGDMIVQSGHVAIYAGNGQVISGGMNGVNATMTHPLSWLTATGGVTFVRA
jgi:cell wall-associated NlpC family hydrolase